MMRHFSHWSYSCSLFQDDPGPILDLWEITELFNEHENGVSNAMAFMVTKSHPIKPIDVLIAFLNIATYATLKLKHAGLMK